MKDFYESRSGWPVMMPCYWLRWRLATTIVASAAVVVAEVQAAVAYDLAQLRQSFVGAKMPFSWAQFEHLEIWKPSVKSFPRQSRPT